MSLQLVPAVSVTPAFDAELRRAEANVLSRRFTAKLERANAAARRLRELGYRVASQDLQISTNAPPLLTIDRTENVSIKPLLAAGENTQWSTDNTHGKTDLAGCHVVFSVRAK